ncbi:alcohol dehydrogenase catalytic domain-containing protein [Chitinophaga sedimenti]|uniref:alcohol dehydrogenase catalytic domain-containing protein n=1 Tax=Chitinophaga sedimenti TaxID=2033606 RepID=UPI002003EDDC|nr:alcohol dehydrogenase catalytic domain-containing protein [Chitinophaga sedimenti]MCK7554719.1 alcohol dehydrogenase catalytic domain-containing protein [Chitinophaga sedimenti]
MKTWICTAHGIFSRGQAAMPVEKEGHAIIKIRRIGICGTDLHAFQGTQPYFSYPRILGHELSGTLLSEVDGFTVGDAVTFIPYFHCGTCIACRSGKPNCCVNINVFGVHIDGG